MQNTLSSALSGYGARISHIGSTAINGIWANPIIDIFVETLDRKSMGSAERIILSLGLLKMSEDETRI